MVNNSKEDELFLDRLRELVEANLENEQFGVSELAKEMEMSRSSIYVKIKRAKDQSVSQFIRDIRLQKAKELLEQNNMTVSEVAYKVGFSSPSYFNQCFHDYYGYPPGEHINHVENEPDDENAKETAINVQHKISQKKRYQFALIALIIIVVGISGVYFFLTGNAKEKSFDKIEKSIAFLPMECAGDDPEIQSLADGITEDILNNLAHVENLTVKPKNSTEKYRDLQKTTPEIAKEQNVNFLIEATLFKEEDNIRIYIKLLDAVNDKLVWSQKYDNDLSEIFTFITDVSLQIASELEAVLTEDEREQINKNYTQNSQAYQLYQKGRYFWNRRTEEDLNRSVDYFNQAIAIDPNYSLAWAGLADAYFIMTGWQWILPESEGLKKSKECALKSLEIDNSISEAHTVLGGIAYTYEYNWEEAEKELKLAIELNPNNDIARMYYGEYLSYRGKFEEAAIQLTMAVELGPNAPMNYAVRSAIYYNTGNFSAALIDTRKAAELKEFDNEHWALNLRNFKIYIRQNDDLKAIEELKKILSNIDPEYLLKNSPEDVYAKSGIEGIIYYMIEWINSKSPESLPPEMRIAHLYSLLGDWDNVIDHLEKALQYHKNVNKKYIPINKYNSDFEPILNDPRFISIIKEFGLEDM